MRPAAGTGGAGVVRPFDGRMPPLWTHVRPRGEPACEETVGTMDRRDHDGLLRSHASDLGGAWGPRTSLPASNGRAALHCTCLNFSSRSASWTAMR